MTVAYIILTHSYICICISLQLLSKKTQIAFLRGFFAFCGITFKSIEIRPVLKAPKSDHLNLSFVKDIHTVGGKMAKNDRKTAIYQLQILVKSL